MRTYGRKFADKFIKKKTRAATETRDGILWSIDWDNRICKVKIQGSNEELAAHFPQNEALHPSYMKLGNAVRLIHRGGVRGYLEVTGHGMAIPTPVSGNSHPDTSDLADAILSGCELILKGGFNVEITDGTFRIDETIYSITGGEVCKLMDEDSEETMSEAYPPMTMDDSGTYEVMDEDTEYVMNEDDPPMLLDDVSMEFTLDDPPSGNKFRYDAFYVDADGLIHYLKGDEASSSPSKPSIPDNCLQLGEYILVYTGMTEVTEEQHGMDYETQIPSSISLSVPDEMEWTTSEVNITATILDQYGFAISKPYNFSLSMLKGSGDLYSGDSGYDSSVTQEVTASGYTFKYRRDTTALETSPYFYIEESNYDLVAFETMTLLDEFGNEVSGSEISAIQKPTTGPTVAIDWSEGNLVEITMDQDITFTFTGASDFDKLILRIRQDAVGGWTPTLPANVRYCDEITAETVSTGANTVSYLGFLYDATDEKYDLVANTSNHGV